MTDRGKHAIVRIVLALPVVLFALGGCAASSPGRRPLIVLLEDEPWSLGVVASASPVFAVYDDGLVIYLERAGGWMPTYASVTLSESERAQLLASLPRAIDDLDEYHDLLDMPHQPFNVLHTWSRGRRKTAAVYGDLGHDPALREKCPAAFLAAYDTLHEFTHERAVAWRPERVAVHFSEQELRSPPRRPWPAGWPDLSHPDTRRVSDGHVLYLDVGHVKELVALWQHPHDSHADVEINGRQGRVTWWVPFPCHEAWEDWGQDAGGS